MVDDQALKEWFCREVLPVVAWVLRVNLLSLVGLLILYRLAVWIGLVTREPLGAREAVTAG